MFLTSFSFQLVLGELFLILAVMVVLYLMKVALEAAVVAVGCIFIYVRATSSKYEIGDVMVAIIGGTKRVKIDTSGRKLRCGI